MIATVAVSRSATTTDAKAVRTANSKVETMANICKVCNMQTWQLLLDKDTGSRSTNVGQPTKAVERILLITRTLHPQLTYFRIWSGSMSRIWSLKEVRCLPGCVTFLGSGASDTDQSLDQCGEHEKIKEYKATEPTQKISNVMDNKNTLLSDTIKQVEEDFESPVSLYISKIVDLSTGEP